MKKGLKGLFVLSIGMLLAGCSCNNQEGETPLIENKYDENYVYDDVNTNITNLYKECVQSVVKITAGSQVGSGVIYKEEGNYAYILTNAHVLTDSAGNTNYANIDVLFSNFVEVKGTFIFLDRNEDVAVISVAKSTNYKVAKITSSDSNVEIGASIFAIGSPNNMPFSMTTGIVSANRYETSTSYISGDGDTTTYVYNTTATINPGNSGGPIFNSDGEVIAINTMRPVTIIKDADGKKHEVEPADKRNHNYSIPINRFIKVADYIVTNRTSYVRGKLNLEVRSICDYSVDEVNTQGISVKKGVHIRNSSEVEIVKGRVITHVNGIEVATSEDYEFELLKYSKNDTIQITTVDKLGSNSKNVNVKLR